MRTVDRVRFGSRWLLALTIIAASGCSADKPVLEPDEDPSSNRSLDERTFREPPRVFSAPVQAPPRGEAAASVEVAISPEKILRGRTTRVHVLVSVRSRVRSARRPLALALVVDRSGSMQEKGKIAFARKAAHIIVENLTARDTFALVGFSSQAEVLAPAGSVQNRPLLHHRVDELEADGSTNLSAGLLEGYAQLEGAASWTGPRSVLLLSDGLANRGITSRDQLVSIVRAARRRGISVSAIGLGLDYDGPLLAALADAGGGRFVHVPEAEDLPAACARELRGLLAVAAQNLAVTLSLRGRARLVRTSGADAPGTERGRVVLALGDLAASGLRRAMLEIEVTASKEAQAVQAGEIIVRYQDARDGALVKKRVPLAFTTTDDPGLVKQSTRPVVEILRRLKGLIDLVHTALVSRDDEVAAAAQQAVRTQLLDIKKTASGSEDPDVRNYIAITEHLAEEMETLVRLGGTHDHAEARKRFKKSIEYQRFLLFHHLGESHGDRDGQ